MCADELRILAQEGAFDEAVKGVNAILHIASPVTASADDPDELILPAVNGTKAVNSSPVKSTSVVNFFSQTPYMLIHNTEIGNKWKDFLVQEEGRKA